MDIKEARAAVNAEVFGTDAWEKAMQVVRNLTAQEPIRASMNVRLVPTKRGTYRAIKVTKARA